jgi:cysteine synthase
MIDLNINNEVRRKNIERCRQRNIMLPTFAHMKNPSALPEAFKIKLKGLGLWDIDPLNLFRITWKNEPVDTGGLFGAVNYIEIPPAVSGTKARILVLVGKWFPTGAHKVGATYGCLAPELVTGRFEATMQKAVWPSTGNYCRGGAYNSELLGCDSIAILPEEMSTERFNWLSNVAGEVIATPGSESNVKEIFDKCRELKEQRGDSIVIFNQFSEFGNYLWHYEVSGSAIHEMLEKETDESSCFRAYVSATGSGGTLAAGDYLKQQFPNMNIVAAEALQCPTLLRNGFGAHRIEGIGDKHIPWIHNVRNTDMVLAVDDQDAMDLVRLFNEDEGKEFLAGQGIPEDFLDKAHLLGISGWANVVGAVKTAKYFEMAENDVLVTIATDSMELYQSRVEELAEKFGRLNPVRAAMIKYKSLDSQSIDNMIELGYYDRLRIHNLKYYTWIEQQDMELSELNDQWYDRNYWKRIQQQVGPIDQLINNFNSEIGVS